MTSAFRSQGKLNFDHVEDWSWQLQIFENKQEHEIWANVDHPNVMAVIGKCFNSFPMLSILEAVEVIIFIIITVIIIIIIITIILVIIAIVIIALLINIFIF